MERSGSTREHICLGLSILLPFVVFGAWLSYLLPIVDAQERTMQALGPLAYGTFVQLVHNYSEGSGWVQTLHQGYAEEWRWGGHYTPILYFTGWLASFSDSPWALARVQVGLVGTGILWAALLGWSEARHWGLLAGLLLYAGSAPVILLALADYQDLILLLPLLPLAVWAARHAPWPLFLLIGGLVGTTREEALVLLPLLGLSGGLSRGIQGGLVSLAYLLYYATLGRPGYPNPLYDIMAGQLRAILGESSPSGGGSPAIDPMALLRPGAVPWALHSFVAGSTLPYLAMAPRVLLPALPVVVFHALDPLSVRDLENPSFHHLTPIVGFSICAAIVGISRLLRGGPAIAVPLLLTLSAGVWWSWETWQPRLRASAVRIDRGNHAAAYELLAQVPAEDVLFVDLELSAAAAKRRYVFTADSLRDPQVVRKLQGRRFQWAIRRADAPGTPQATAGEWALFKDPLPAQLSTPEQGPIRPNNP